MTLGGGQDSNGGSHCRCGRNSRKWSQEVGLSGCNLMTKPVDDEWLLRDEHRTWFPEMASTAAEVAEMTTKH